MSRFLTDIMSKKAEKPKLEAVPKTELKAEESLEQPSSTTNPSQVAPSTNHPQVVPTPPNHKTNNPVSPVKNFTKVPNSLAAEAIPQGMFKGLSKHTYDVLYKLTRGAINPVRKIQLTQLELMKLTGLSENTLRSHIKYLSVKGFLKISYQIGKHEGATYEVFIPEEMAMISSTNPSQVVPSSTSEYQAGESSTNVSQNLVLDPSQLLGDVGTTPDFINIDKVQPGIQREDKSKSDDEAFARMIDKLNAACEKIGGRKSSAADAEKWENLADLLILELEIASRRTDAVSSVPAFLTEVLRRKLRNTPTTTKPYKVKTDTVGKSESGEYEIKPLDKQGREAALEQLQEFAGDEMLKDFEKWYTPEDWQWLMKELEKKQ